MAIREARMTPMISSDSPTSIQCHAKIQAAFARVLTKNQGPMRVSGLRIRSTRAWVKP